MNDNQQSNPSLSETLHIINAAAKAMKKEKWLTYSLCQELYRTKSQLLKDSLRSGKAKIVSRVIRPRLKEDDLPFVLAEVLPLILNGADAVSVRLSEKWQELSIEYHGTELVEAYRLAVKREFQSGLPTRYHYLHKLTELYGLANFAKCVSMKVNGRRSRNYAKLVRFDYFDLWELEIEGELFHLPMIGHECLKREWDGSITFKDWDYKYPASLVWGDVDITNLARAFSSLPKNAYRPSRLSSVLRNEISRLKEESSARVD
ncbi:hypothetical protein [Vibrio mediterranei]|uniref:hypothetical protein n=1 Tax=Vibrio mediterranei TaxID=689 RepID=UPI0040698F0F